MRHLHACALLLIAASAAAAADWPQFGRDASRNGVSPEKNPPTWWQLPERDDDKKPLKPPRNVRWAAEVSSNGSYSNRIIGDPVVAGGLVWVGVNEAIDLGEEKGLDHRTALVCLDEKTGKELFRRPTGRIVESGQDGRWHAHGSSPCVEGDSLWVLTNRSEVVCLDLAPLRTRTGPPRERWVLDTRKTLGVTPAAALFPHRRSSPAVYKDWVYVGTGHGRCDWRDRVADAPSFLCLEKATGKVVWADKSPGQNIIHIQTASPTVIEAGGRAQVVVPQGDGWVRAFDPPTGKLLWEFDTNPHDAVSRHEDFNNPRNELLAAAVFHGGKLYVGNGSNPELSDPPGWLYCIDPTRTGDISPVFTRGPDKGKANPNSGMVWKYGGVGRSVPKDKWGRHPVIFGRTLTNVAVADGLVIACDVSGRVHCLDAATGRVCWTHTDRELCSIQGSPLVVGGRVYVASCYGGVWMFDLSREKRVLGRIGDEFWSQCSPVFANGTLYLADNQRLYAVAGDERRPNGR